MKKSSRLLLLALWAGWLGCGGGGGPAEDPYANLHTSWRRARVLVADRDVGRLSVIDIEDEEVIATLEIPAPVRLAATHTGNFGLLIGAASLGFVSSGVAILDHVDHIHIYKAQPRVHPFAIDGGSPRWVVSSAGWLSVLQGDRVTRRAQLVEEQSLMGPMPQPRVQMLAGTSAPELVIPFGVELLAVSAGTLSTRTWAVNGIIAGADRPLGACADPSAHVVLEDRAAIACADALVVVERAEGAVPPVRFHRVSYPPGARPRTLHAHPGSKAIVGDMGARGFVIFRHGSDGAWTSASVQSPVPTDVCAFGLEQRDGSRVVALGADGVLRDFTLDMPGPGLRSSARIVAPFACDAVTKAELALSPERAYVSDPARGAVHDIDLRNMKRVRSFAVGGKPGPLAVLGIDLKNANVAPGAEHGDDAGAADAGATDASASDGSASAGARE